MNQDRIDLSMLDPSRDQPRWEQTVQSVASRAWAARRRRLSIGGQLSVWARPVLAIAAAVSLVSWAGALTSNSSKPANVSDQQEPAAVLLQWANNDEVPPTSQILQVLGEGHVNE